MGDLQLWTDQYQPISVPVSRKQWQGSGLGLSIQIYKSAGSDKAAGAWALSLLLFMVSVNNYEQNSLPPKLWFVLRTDVMFSNITSCI